MQNENYGPKPLDTRTLSTQFGVDPEVIRSLGISRDEYDGATSIDLVGLIYDETGGFREVRLMNDRGMNQRANHELHLDHTWSQKVDYILTKKENIILVANYWANQVVTNLVGKLTQ